MGEKGHIIIIIIMPREEARHKMDPGSLYPRSIMSHECGNLEQDSETKGLWNRTPQHKSPCLLGS